MSSLYTPLILCVVFFVLLGVIASLHSPTIQSTKGRLGEALVRSRLEKNLPPDKYVVINNLYLPLGNRGTTQIDHVVVSPFGVFVIETKTFTGWVFGDKHSTQWTQMIHGKKFRFQNPIRQNWLHICAISDNLGLPKDFLRGIVVFAGDAEFKTSMPEGVVYAHDIADHILSFTQPLCNAADCHEIAEVLKEWDTSVSQEQRASHVANLRIRLEHQLQGRNTEPLGERPCPRPSAHTIPGGARAAF